MRYPYDSENVSLQLRKAKRVFLNKAFDFLGITFRELIGITFKFVIICTLAFFILSFTNYQWYWFELWHPFIRFAVVLVTLFSHIILRAD